MVRAHSVSPLGNRYGRRPIEVDPDDDLLTQPEPEIEFDQRVQW